MLVQLATVYTTTFKAASNSGTITYTPYTHYTGTVTIQIDAYDTPTGSIVFTTTRNVTVTASAAATITVSPTDTTVAVNTVSNFLVQVTRCICKSSYIWFICEPNYSNCKNR